MWTRAVRDMGRKSMKEFNFIVFSSRAMIFLGHYAVHECRTEYFLGVALQCATYEICPFLRPERGLQCNRNVGWRIVGDSYPKEGRKEARERLSHLSGKEPRELCDKGWRIPVKALILIQTYREWDDPIIYTAQELLTTFRMGSQQHNLLLAARP